MPGRKRSRVGKTAIVTFPGEDGAAAAALFLLKYPSAEVILSSKSKIGGVLKGLPGKGYRQMHVCAVGIPAEDLDRVVQALARLKRQGTKSTWYCGAGYLEEFREALQPHCRCQFGNDGMSISEYIFRQFYPDGSGEVEENIIRFVGTKYASKEDIPTGFKAHWERIDELKTLVQAAVRRWINLEDMAAFPHAVRVLAGVDELNSQDRKMIQSFNEQQGTYLKGKSAVIKKLRKTIARCGPFDSQVLITGETGTGKEVVARLVHECSGRSNNPFASINCANLEGSLLQDRLFGHKKGAYTGADSDRAGLFEIANGGTLFLDEVGEMPLATQAQLLRVIQEGEYLRLGDDKPRETDVRIIAATNRDLLEKVECGDFRQDLYFRLAVILIHLPPLRERKEDIPTLADHVLYSLCKKYKLKLIRLKPRQMDQLKNYRWPGNIRELQNVLERYIVMGQEDIRAALLTRSCGVEMEEKIVPLEDYTNRYVNAVVERMDGNLSQAAKALDITRNTLKARLNKA